VDSKKTSEECRVGGSYTNYMSAWSGLPKQRLLADVSLWSADLANLERSIRMVESYADSFHLDAADGHFVKSLLFFPDLVKALRNCTPLPFHVHLMTTSPEHLIEEFVEAGADVLTIHAELPDEVVTDGLRQIREAGLVAGLALTLDTPVHGILPWVGDFDVVLLLGTRPGIKGCELDAGACDRIREMSRLLRREGLRERVRIVADGGIRESTVPGLRAAGVDVIVPGSLFFGSTELAKTADWVRRLPGEEAPCW
jgi:ribulose-phosphate 3-epimerase